LLRRGKADLLTQAAAIYQDALRQWRELGERRYEMKTLIYLAAINERQENFRRFIELYSQALPIARDLGHRRFEGISLHGLGYGWHKLGEYRKALEYYRQALTIRQSLGAGGRWRIPWPPLGRLTRIWARRIWRWTLSERPCRWLALRATKRSSPLRST